MLLRGLLACALVALAAAGPLEDAPPLDDMLSDDPMLTPSNHLRAEKTPSFRAIASVAILDAS